MKVIKNIPNVSKNLTFYFLYDYIEQCRDKIGFKKKAMQCITPCSCLESNNLPVKV